MPNIDGGDLLQEVYGVAESLGLEVECCTSGSPMWIDPETPSIRELATLSDSHPRTVCYGTDGGELSDLKDRVVFGPGDIAQAHTTDEWIALEELDLGTKKFSQILRHWCC
jgi:acetylornithine deacetylase